MFESVPWRLVSLAGNFAVECLRPDDVMVGMSQIVHKYVLQYGFLITKMHHLCYYNVLVF